MGMFIREDRSMANEIIPGTVFLEKTKIDDDSSLKKVPGTTIILQPQPSDSLKDPYNWSKNTKLLYFIGLLISSMGASAVGPLLGPGFTLLATEFNKPLNEIVQINGSLVLALGVSSYLCNQLCAVYGKRPLFLLTTLIEVACTIWAACSQNYTSLIAARVCQGLGMGMTFAAAGTVSISDVFFVHERARMIGIWNFSILTVNCVTPIVSGYVIQLLSWRWAFGFLAIYYGISLLSHFFLVPESGFKRKRDSTSILYPVVTSTDSHSGVVESKEQTVFNIQNLPNDLSLDVEKNNYLKQDEKPTYWETLKPYSGRKSDLSVGYMLQRPFLLLQNPIVIWGVLQWCLGFVWVILISSVSAQMFTAPPYNFSVSQTGVIAGVSPLIGTTIGSLLSGYSSDYLVDYLAKKNNGIYEPEFRLLMMIPYLILLVVGGFGVACEYGKSSSTVVGVFIAILFCGVSFGCTGIMTYAVDTLDASSGEAFGIMMFFKSIFAFGLIFALTDWFENRGAKNFYSIMTGVTIFIILLTIPMYIYGKKVRLYMKHHAWYKYDL